MGVKIDEGAALHFNCQGIRGTPMSGLHMCMPPNRICFLRVAIVKQGKTFAHFGIVPCVFLCR